MDTLFAALRVIRRAIGARALFSCWLLPPGGYLDHCRRFLAITGLFRRGVMVLFLFVVMRLDINWRGGAGDFAGTWRWVFSRWCWCLRWCVLAGSSSA